MLIFSSSLKWSSLEWNGRARTVEDCIIWYLGCWGVLSGLRCSSFMNILVNCSALPTQPHSHYTLLLALACKRSNLSSIIMCECLFVSQPGPHGICS